MKRLTFFLTIILNLFLIFAIVILMSYVTKRLNVDVQINLTEVVTQNRDVITSKILLEINRLHFVAESIIEQTKNKGTIDPATLKTVFFDYCTENNLQNVFFALPDGTAFFTNSEVISISGRQYFKLVMEGKQNISSRITSRFDGEEVFVISVPLIWNGKILSSLQRICTPEEMSDICSISLFSSQGKMYLINKQGYILIDSGNIQYSNESDNFFRMMYAQGNHEAVRNLENNVQNNKSGFMETVVDGKKMFSAYMPIEAIHDWYLISSIATEAISSNAKTVIQIFYVILLVIATGVTISLFYFRSYKNKQQITLEQLAFTDNVTGGKTLTKFTVDFKQIIHTNPEKLFFILKFDLVNFKYVNNYYGFDCGDRILRFINQTLEKMLSPCEQIARISGDHFVLLLEDASDERLYKMRSAVQKEEGIPLYYSAGLYNISNPEESLNLMIDKASTAAQAMKGDLYKIVEVYTEKFDRQMIHNEQMKRAIQQAITDNEIEPFFQPKVNVFTGQLDGAEALARWRTKEGKLISPGEFIPICEKTGLIMELDMIVYEKTLQFLQNCLSRGIKCVPISVNFSRHHLFSTEFISMIIEKLQKYAVPANLIEVELTETAIFENHEIINDFIEQLHQNDFHISMDDFGSGYSSLNMLKDIPIDVLKIDRGFLMETSDTAKRNIILHSIIQMAHQLHIKVVVEGVETKENVELMKEFSCAIAQGYYFAKPMDMNSFQKIYEGDIPWKND